VFSKKGRNTLPGAAALPADPFEKLVEKETENRRTQLLKGHSLSAMHAEGGKPGLRHHAEKRGPRPSWCGETLPLKAPLLCTCTHSWVKRRSRRSVSMGGGREKRATSRSKTSLLQLRENS